MFSSTQNDVVNSVVNNYIARDYDYYVAHTNTIRNYDNDTYDLTIYLSKEEITPLDSTSVYNFNVKNCVKVEVNTKNYNYNTSSQQLPRLFVQNYNQTSLYINDYEFVYSNAKDYVGMDIISYQDNCIAYNMTQNDVLLPSVAIMILILYMWLGRWFGHAKGDDY